MATLAQIRDKADAKLQDFWTALSARQEAYHLKHGKYFQLLVTSPVVDGVDSVFSVVHPSDETHVIDVDLTFNSPIPFQIRVDEWSNNQESGYAVTVVVELLDGRKFTRNRRLTDPRIRQQDIDNTDPENPVNVGEPYYVGQTSIVTSPWSEVIEEQI